MSEKPTRRTLAGARYLALRALARDTSRTTAELILFYAIKGFLARLVKSTYRDRLVLKGGVLLTAWGARRPTRDIDLCGVGVSNEVEAARSLIAEISRVPEEDGLEFDAAGAVAETIREGGTYPGVRISLRARLGTAVVTFHIDLNFGDPIWPGPCPVELPRLLSQARIRVSGYPLVMVIAEKTVTAMQRGTANTRWRDFADLRRLAELHPVDGAELQRAISEVAGYRGAALRPLRESLVGMAELAQPRWDAWRRPR